MAIAERRAEWTDQERVIFLLDAAREFGRTLDESRIYHSLQKLLSDALQLDGLIVSAFDPVAEDITCEFIWSDGAELDPRAFPPVKWKKDGTGMQGKVILSGKAEIFDVGQKVRDPNASYVQVSGGGAPEPVKEEPATRTAMMAPMILEGVVTGVVQAMSDRRDAYTAEDLSIFESIALLMTPAWHNARTYQRASRQTKLTDRILETSPDIVYIFDLRTRKIEFSNGQLERQLGYSGGEVAAMHEQTILTVMHPEDAARLPQLLQRYDTASDNDLLESEWRIAAKSGEWRYFLNRARVFERDEDGRAIKILGFATDVTQKREAEVLRRESDERYRFLAENGTAMVWTAGPDGSVDYTNCRWSEYFGEGVEGRTRAERAMIIHPEERERIREGWREAVERGIDFECEARLKRADDSYRWHLVRATPMFDGDGKPIRWFGMSIDIHDQKEVEAELEARVRERTTELEAAVKELEGFTYSVSHDLRGPLRAISGASMIIREDYGQLLPEEAHHYLLRQSEAAKKMGTLIDDLLKLSRLGRQELSCSDVDLSEIAADVARELSTDQVRVEPEMSAYGDPTLLRFVLLNLIENALKFSPEGGEIVVGREGKSFFVRDRGIGFEMQYATKLFRPFERLVREEDYPGTGIGLANVQRIVQRHRGKVWAESEPGQGSTFWFTLPGRRE